MEALSYKLETFEGPMDLLLHLISKKKVKIEDVPIMELVEQYLDYVKQMKEENLDVASDFLEMAARLVYIKTVSLLPVHEEEADRLAEELRGELTEYRDCQLMAGKLAQQANGFNYFSRKPEVIKADAKYTRIHEPNELYKHYMAAVGKGKRKLPPPVEAFSGIIAKKIVSVSSRFAYILKKLNKNKKQTFNSIFDKSTSRSEMVATFMAMLALVKSKKVIVEGEGDDADIVLVNSRGES